MTTTFYVVQVMDDGFPKMVPHTNKKKYYFLDRKKAVQFRTELKKNNQDQKFRILKKIETFRPEEWV